MKIMKNIKKTTTLLAVLAALSTSSIACMAYAADATSSAPTSSTSVTTKVNINTADATAIAGKVKGLGEKRAEAVVAYRNEHGAYKSFDDLAQVKGIGESFVKTHMDALNQAFTLS